MPKTKRVNKTKEQLIAENQLVQETARKRVRVSSDLYPYLKSLDLSTDRIHQLCYLMGQFVRQGFIGLQKTMKLEELKMDQVLKGEDMKEYLHLYNLFSGETIQSVLEFTEGMSKQIDDVMKLKYRETKFNEIDLKLYQPGEK